MTKVVVQYILKYFVGNTYFSNLQIKGNIKTNKLNIVEFCYHPLHVVAAGLIYKTLFKVKDLNISIYIYMYYVWEPDSFCNELN